MRFRFTILVVCLMWGPVTTLAEEMRLPEIGSLGRGVALLWEGPQDRRVVALTFDDGPIPGKTEPVLDLLRDSKVPATFFVLGENAERHPEILERMVTEGHEIGNHTYSHPDLTKLPTAKVRKEISRCQSIVQEAVGYRPRFFRPPYGAANLTVLSILSSQSLSSAFWSVDPQDWKGGSGEEIVNEVSKHLENGSIILLHERSPNTYQSVPKLIQVIREKGFQFVTLGQMFGLPNLEGPKEAVPTSVAIAKSPSSQDLPVPNPKVASAPVKKVSADRIQAPETGPKTPAADAPAPAPSPSGEAATMQIELRGTQPSLPSTLPVLVSHRPGKKAAATLPPTPLPPPTQPGTATMTPSFSPSPTLAPSPSSTPTATPTPSPTLTPSFTASPTSTPTPSPTEEAPHAYGPFRPVEFRRLHPIKHFSHRFIVEEP